MPNSASLSSFFSDEEAVERTAAELCQSRSGVRLDVIRIGNLLPRRGQIDEVEKALLPGVVPMRSAGRPRPPDSRPA